MLTNQQLFCQNNEITFEQIFLQHGLSQSIVTHILQDKTGFMWIATEDGLNKFDGYEFKVYRSNPQNPNSLSYNQITFLYEDKEGIIWLGTFYGGLDRFDPVKNEFIYHRYDINNANTLSNNNVNAIFEDYEGCLWIGTDAGLNRYDRNKNEFVRFFNNPGKNNTLSNDIVRSICEDAEKNLWIGTDNGLNKFNRKDNTFTVFRNEPGNVNSLSNNEVYSLYKDHAGTLWAGTRGGGLNKVVLSQKDKSYSFISFRNNPRDSKSISNNQVYSIFEDSRGRFWVGTNRGLDIFDRKNKTFASYLHDPIDPSSLSYNEIRAIYEDRSGLIWIGTYGGGIDLVNRGKKEFSLYKNIPNSANSLNENIVWSIFEDENGIIWIGTHGGGLNRFDRAKNIYTHYLHNPNDRGSISSNIVRLLFKDRESNIWVGTHGGGLNKFDRSTGKFISYQHNANNPSSISHNELRSMYQDRSGTIWVGTNGGGLNKMVFPDGNKGEPKFITYKNIPNDSNSISNNFVRVILEDRHGNLWIGTQGGGLNKFDREKKIFKHYRAKKDSRQSIDNDYIFSIFEDSKGRLWLGTWGGGLIKFDPENETYTCFTTKEGLPSDAIYGMLEDENGFLWLSTNNGLSKFDTEKLTFKNYNVNDGLQNNEFNGGAFFKSRNGEMFFGGIGGFNSFFPDRIKDNTIIPSVVITSFKKLNQEVVFGKSINAIHEMELFREDYLFSFEFASLDYNAPQKNKYAYMMEGLDNDWIVTTADKRYAVYTTLPPGNYRFRVKASNNDGIWNDYGTYILIKILPPYWKTWWFITLCILICGGIAFVIVKRRVHTVRIIAELKAAHEAQMSIMPQRDPDIESFDFSALCIPASEVGGDFFDYIWMNDSHTRLGIVIGDVSGKGMKSAMNALMCSGMLIPLIQAKYSIHEIMTRVNKSLFLKTDRKMFTVLNLSVLDLVTRELRFANAGFNPPLVKTKGKVKVIESIGPRFPLGGFSNTEYQEQSYQLLKGDILLFFTDGINEAQNKEKELYGINNLIYLLENMDTDSVSAMKIKEAIFADIKRFTNHTNQSDDMTLIVIKILTL
jgi:ligand-binding sensor domain-containing protein